MAIIGIKNNGDIVTSGTGLASNEDYVEIRKTDDLGRNICIWPNWQFPPYYVHSRRFPRNGPYSYVSKYSPDEPSFYEYMYIKRTDGTANKKIQTAISKTKIETKVDTNI
ncbi:hypothetical protein CHUAL_010692 [Chamberlinius hualienensis]